MSRTNKADLLTMRVSKEDKAKYDLIAKSVYGLDRSEFIRLALSYVMDKRPILGKNFAPESMNN